MLRLGLCCQFKDVDIKFRHSTARYLLSLNSSTRKDYASALYRHNAQSLIQAIDWCHEHGIGAFRILSQILPVITHPEAGVPIDEVPARDEIIEQFQEAGRIAAKAHIRLSFHPDQFVVLNSPNPHVVAASIRDLEYQAMVADWVGADVINIHAGGADGNKLEALDRLGVQMARLPQTVRSKLVLENDDRTFSPEDLLPLCASCNIPLNYDVHHHRCLPDKLRPEEAWTQALATWNREPLFHISSPKEGWGGSQPSRHHEYINPADFPEPWGALDITVDVEAKAKERAVLQLAEHLRRQGVEVFSAKKGSLG